MSYKTIAIKPPTFKLLDDCESIYRSYHKELDRIPISKEKLLFEICKFYLQKTRLKVDE